MKFDEIKFNQEFESKNYNFCYKLLWKLPDINIIAIGGNPQFILRIIKVFIEVGDIENALEFIDVNRHHYIENDYFKIYYVIVIFLSGDVAKFNEVKSMLTNGVFDSKPLQLLQLRAMSYIHWSEKNYEAFNSDQVLISEILAGDKKDKTTMIWLERLKIININRIICNSPLSPWSSTEYSLYTNNTELLDIIYRAVIEKKPFSFVRLGDGEGAVMQGNNRHLSGAICNVRQESYDISDIELSEVIMEVQSSCDNADIIGLPRHDMTSCDYKYAITNLLDHTMNKIESKKIIVTDCHAHYSLFSSGLFDELIRRCTFIGYVGGRNICKYVESMSPDSAQFVWHATPSELAYSSGLDQSHYPYYYNRIRNDINVPYEGAVYFIAAGILGKVYANEVKRQGGIALDIGAIADIWSGTLGTRPFIKSNL